MSQQQKIYRPLVRPKRQLYRLANQLEGAAADRVLL
jgi:hypothetical protein